MRKKENIQTYKKNISKIREYYKLKDLLYKTSKTEFALNKINEFLEKYPNDSVALSLCASVLRQRGDPESGLLLLTEVDCDSLQSIKERSLCYLEMEEESRALLEIDKIPINNLEADSEIETLRFLLEVEQGFHDQAILRKLTYAKQQMVDYNKERLFYHLEKYLNGNNKRVSSFNEEIDIRNIMKKLRSILESKELKRSIVETGFPTYSFKLDDIGYLNEEEKTNYLNVVTLPNTNNILTIYPVDKRYLNEINDYQQLSAAVDNDKELILTKSKVSQVDKFNNRYNKQTNKQTN